MNYKCSVDGCKRIFYKHVNSNPYCEKHCLQMLYFGNTTTRISFDKNEIIKYDDYAEIILYDKNQNAISKTIIDIDDIEKCSEHKWYLKKSGGNKVYVQKRMGRLHLSHFIINFNKKEGYDVDHIDGNTLNNKKNNLRIVTRQQNMMNQRKLPKNNTSGVIGLWYNKIKSLWEAQIKINKKPIHLGSYKNKDDAIKARKNAELKYFGEYKSINFEENK